MTMNKAELEQLESYKAQRNVAATNVVQLSKKIEELENELRLFKNIVNTLVKPNLEPYK